MGFTLQKEPVELLLAACQLEAGFLRDAKLLQGVLQGEHREVMVRHGQGELGQPFSAAWHTAGLSADSQSTAACGAANSLTQDGSSKARDPGQPQQPTAGTHLPRHLLDLIPVENQTSPHELIAVRKEQRAEQKGMRGSFSSYLEPKGSLARRRELLSSPGSP